MSNDSEPIRELECNLMIMGIRPGTHFRLIKIARSEAGVIYHHICLVLLYLYTVLTRQESGFQLRRINFVKV
jgi:hypothetical protein